MGRYKIEPKKRLRAEAILGFQAKAPAKKVYPRPRRIAPPA
jgi:hypothetical protein